MTLSEWKKRAQETPSVDLLDLVLADWEADQKGASELLRWLGCLEQAGVDNWQGAGTGTF